MTAKKAAKKTPAKKPEISKLIIEIHGEVPIKIEDADAYDFEDMSGIFECIKDFKKQIEELGKITHKKVGFRIPKGLIINEDGSADL